MKGTANLSACHLLCKPVSAERYWGASRYEGADPHPPSARRDVGSYVERLGVTGEENLEPGRRRAGFCIRHRGVALRVVAVVDVERRRRPGEQGNQVGRKLWEQHRLCRAAPGRQFLALGTDQL